MPNQSLLFTGRVLACSQLHHMMHIARELCGGQICVTPDKATFDAPETKPWLDKFYTVNDGWPAEDRRKLLAFARDLLNSDYAGHRLTFQLFAQSPPFANLAAVYRNFDWDGPLAFVRKSAGLSERVLASGDRGGFDKAPAQWAGGEGDESRRGIIAGGAPLQWRVIHLPDRERRRSSLRARTMSERDARVRNELKTRHWSVAPPAMT